MSSFFNVSALGEIRNPFSTPVGQRIDQATDATLASENWALNMEICDMINESSDTARDAMKAIRKKLQQNAGKNYTVIMYTLTVLETCVKNCGKAFHMLVAQKDFIQELVKLIGPKNDPPAVVQEKVLNLIQIWADTFRSTAELNGVVQVYQELKNKGIEFPPADLETMAPIYTPQRSVPAESSSAVPQPQIILPTSPQHNVIQLQPGSPAIAGSPGNVQPLLLNQQQHQQQQQQQQMHHQQQQQQHQQQIVNNGGGGGPGMNGNMIVNAGPVGAGISIGPINTTPEQNAKIQSELDIVSLNMSILSDMLNELKPGQEDPSDYRLLIELTNTCKEMQGRIVELIGRINHDEITAELLRLNDELNNLFLRQQRYEKNHDPQTATVTAATTGNIQSPSAILGAAMGVPITTNGASGAGAATAKDSLIDLSDEPNGGTDQLTSKFSGLGTSQLSQINSVSAQSGGSGTTSTGAISRTKKDVDEFDMFAQSRNTTIGGTKELAAGGDDDINNSSSVPIASSQSQSQSTKHQPKKSSEVVSMLNANESDFDEMAAWLEKADEEDDGPEESLTSKEFDRFLAERAAAADQLPTITPSGLSSTTTTTTGPNNTTPTSTPQRQKNGKNKEEVSLMAL